MAKRVISGRALKFLFASGILRGKGSGKNRTVTYDKARAATVSRNRKRGVDVTSRKKASQVNKSGRHVFGGSKAARLRSGSGTGKRDFSATRAERIAAGRAAAANALGRYPDPAPRGERPGSSRVRRRTELGRVQASLRVLAKGSDAEAARGAQHVAGLPGKPGRKFGEAPGQRGATVRNLYKSGGTAYTALTRGERILKGVQASQRAVYKTPGLSSQEQKRRYAIRKRREEKVRGLLRTAKLPGY